MCVSAWNVKRLESCRIKIKIRKENQDKNGIKNQDIENEPTLLSNYYDIPSSIVPPLHYSVDYYVKCSGKAVYELLGGNKLNSLSDHEKRSLAKLKDKKMSFSPT